MSFSRPRSLQQRCRQAVPPILREADGKGMVDAIAEIVATDRWNSFDRFHETTKTLVRRYEEAGAVVEVDAIQTGGRMGSGRWIIREAADVHAATVDVVAPVMQRLLDYRDNPWHAVQWTSATPAKVKPSAGTSARAKRDRDGFTAERPHPVQSGTFLARTRFKQTCGFPLRNMG